MQKITKEKFYDIATIKGLYLLCAKGMTLNQTKELLDNNANIDTSSFTKTICTRKGNKIYRGTSSLTLDGNDTVYQYGKFIVVYTFTAKDNYCSFDSYNTIIYV